MKRPPHAAVAAPSRRRHLAVWLPLLAIIVGFGVWFFGTQLHSAQSSQISNKPGPWGKLDFVRIDIELPDHFIDVENIDRADWFFPGRTQEQVATFFRSCSLTTSQLDALLHKAQWKMDANGCHVAPEDALILSLTAESRGKIYGTLAAAEENTSQFYAFTYRPEQLPHLLQYSGLQEQTIKSFKSLLYPQGSLLRFGDTDVLLRQLTDRHERLRLVKTVARRSTLLVKLNVTPTSDIDALVQYWGAGGRAKDLKPLLESLARVPEGCRIDIAHLLPPFARERIYTYPDPDQSPEVRQDCHWSSLNFFNRKNLLNFSSPADVAQAIETQYVQVGSDVSKARFGDVLFLKMSDGTLIHSAVYIADDIVFTKNGAGLNQPWIYMTVEDMQAYYAMPGEPLKMAVYRRKQI